MKGYLGGMSKTWEEQIDAFWDSADTLDGSQLHEEMVRLVGEHGVDKPESLYELASVHDFCGEEAEAIDLYQAALSAGLAGERRPQAMIQLASSLRNTGQLQAAVELLQQVGCHEVTGNADQAFLALTLWDQGRNEEAFRTALLALIGTLPLYRRSLEQYARDLGE